MPATTGFERCASSLAELPDELTELVFAAVPDRQTPESAALVSVSGEGAPGTPISVRGYAIAVCSSTLVRLTVDSERCAPSDARAAGLVLVDGESALRAEQLLRHVCSTAAGVAAVGPVVETWDLTGASLTPAPWEFDVVCADGSSVTLPARSEILSALHRGAGLGFPAA
jgi:hypothetical protein